MKSTREIADSSPPFLSQAIAYLSPTDRPADLLRLAISLSLSAPAFPHVITLAFAASGYGLQGAVAAAGSGLSSAYLIRTSAGRIDTDMMNLGLLYVIFGAAIMAGRAKSPSRMLLWCVGAGILARLFLTWYDRSALVWLALAALIFLLVMTRKKPLILVGGAALFIAISGLDFYNPLTSGYLMATLDVSTFKLPNTLSTITKRRTYHLLHDGSGVRIAGIGSGVFSGLGYGLFGIRLWQRR